MLYLLTGALAAYIARQRGRSPVTAGILGVVCPLVGILGALATPPEDGQGGQVIPGPVFSTTRLKWPELAFGSGG